MECQVWSVACTERRAQVVESLTTESGLEASPEDGGWKHRMRLVARELQVLLG